MGRRIPILMGCAALFGVLGVASRAAAPKAVTLPVTYSVTYTEAGVGQNNADGSVTGIVGRGTFSIGTTAEPVPVLRAPAKPRPKKARKPKSAPKPVTVSFAAIDHGGTYVTRYDISPAGTWSGMLVMTFDNKALGSLCLTGSLVFGTYVPGTPFPPSTTTLTSVGGTGLARLLRLRLTAQPTDVQGLDTLELAGAGSVTASLTNTAQPMTADCQAVAKL